MRTNPTPAADPQTNSNPRGRREFLATGALGLAGLTGLGTLGLGATARAGRSLRGRTERVQPGSPTMFGWQERAKGVFASTGELTTGGNCLCIVGSDATMLVDSKFASLAPLLRENAEGLGASPLKYLVNTHHHADHSGGNAGFAEDVEIIAYGPATERIRAQHDSYLGQIRGAANQIARAGGTDKERARALELVDPWLDAAEPLAASAWVPTRTLQTTSTLIDLGGVWAELAHADMNAHTDNDLVVFIPERNVLHTGDLVFNGLHPFFDPSAGVSCRGWMKTLVGLLEFCNDETVVVPGHGPIGDRRLIEAQLKYLTYLYDEVSQEVAKGTPRDAAVNLRWTFMDGLGFEQIRGRAIGAVYDEIAGG